MPWCPKCRNEYKEGYEVCADCGAHLVASLEDIEESSDSNVYAEFEEFQETDAEAAMEIADSILENGNPELNDEAKREVLENIKRNREFKPYVKAKDRAENYRSSAFALLLVGCLGMIFLVLCVFGVVNLTISGGGRILAFVTMLIMFVAFILIGLKSYIVSKTIGELADVEDNTTANIEEYFKGSCTSEDIDKLALSEEEEDLTDEIKYFKRIAVIKDIIAQKFGELDESYVDNETEVIYGILFE